MITVNRELFSVVEENKSLIEEHWNEVVVDGRELDVFWEFFREQDANGSLITIVARDSEGVIGYAVFLAQFHLHCRTLVTAHNDAIFVNKSKRTRAGAMILKRSVEILSELGIKMIFFHVKPAADFGKALLKLGFQFHESVYIKHVGGN